MSTISKIIGWIIIFLIIVVFTDVVGVVRTKVYKERTIGADIFERALKWKAGILAVFVLLFLCFK